MTVGASATRFLALTIALGSSGLARGDENGDAPAAPAQVPSAIIDQARAHFDLGEFDQAVALLEPIAAGRVPVASRVDRLEALRGYAIACALSARPTAAEAAFLLLLREDPSTQLDPALYRPEVVTLFQSVKQRHREELLAAYRKNRPRRWLVLNLLPPAGQFQNRDRVKGSLLGGAEVALLATNLVSGVLLGQWEGPHHDFAGHVDDAKALRPVNWVSFGLLASVVVYGVIDGFAVGHRRAREERHIEARLQSDAAPTSSPAYGDLRP